MARKYSDPEAPEVLQAVLEHIHGMTREEWQAELAWRPPGARPTWRTKHTQDCGSLPHQEAHKKGAACDSPRPAASALAATRKATKR